MEIEEDRLRDDLRGDGGEFFKRWKSKVTVPRFFKIILSSQPAPGIQSNCTHGGEISRCGPDLIILKFITNSSSLDIPRGLKH